MMIKGKKTMVIFLAVSFLVSMVNLAGAAEPSKPVVDTVFNAEKEAKILELENLPLREAFERLQEGAYQIDKALLDKAIFTVFKDAKTEAIDLALDYVKLPVMRIIDGKVVYRDSEFDLAKEILHVFCDEPEAVDKLSALYNEESDGKWSDPSTELLVVGNVSSGSDSSFVPSVQDRVNRIVIIDNQDVGTSQSGKWAVSGGIDPYEADSVYSRDGATFTWHFTPPQSGAYDVSMWWTEYSSRSTNIPVDVKHSGATTRVYINQQQDGGKWNYQGTYFFDVATGDTVTVIAPDPHPSSCCADAVKFSFVQSNEPPVAIIASITPNPAGADDGVAFTGGGEDSDGIISAFSWHSSIDGHLSDQAAFLTTNLSQGEHIITFKVQDNGDTVARSNVISVLGRMAGGQRVRDLLISALDDTTFCVSEYPERTGQLLRICDLAYNQLVLRYMVKDVLRTIGTVHSIEVRDYHINVLKSLL